MQKKSKLALNATVLKFSRVSSISFSATSEIAFCSSISVEIFFDSANISMSTSSSSNYMTSSTAERV